MLEFRSSVYSGATRGLGQVCRSFEGLKDHLMCLTEHGPGFS